MSVWTKTFSASHNNAWINWSKNMLKLLQFYTNCTWKVQKWQEIPDCKGLHFKWFEKKGILVDYIKVWGVKDIAFVLVIIKIFWGSEFFFSLLSLKFVVYMWLVSASCLFIVRHLVYDHVLYIFTGNQPINKSSMEKEISIQ